MPHSILTSPWLPMLLLCSLITGCKREQSGRAGVAPQSAWERVQTEFPAHICEGTPRPYPKLPVPIELRPDFPSVAIATSSYRNLAAGKPVSSSDPHPIQGMLSIVTDGEKQAGEGYFVELNNGPQWVQVDLGKEETLYVIWIWHRSGMDTAVYHDVIVEISNDPEFKSNIIQVFNNDYDNSSGRGHGKELPYTESRFGKPIQVNGVSGRYVRCHSNGCSWGEINDYTEVEVFGREAGDEKSLTIPHPVDPMSLAFQSFERDFWQQLIKQMLNQGVDGLILKGGDKLVIRIQAQPTLGKPMSDKQIAWLKKYVSLADELWKKHYARSSLRSIEVCSATESLIRHNLGSE